LLNNGHETLDRVERELEIELSLQDPKSTEEVNAFIDSSLRHYTEHESDSPSEILELAQTCYRAILCGDLSTLDDIKCKFEELVVGVSPWLGQSNSLLTTQQDYLSLKFSHEQLAAEHERLTRELDLLKSSIFWKLAKPLRVLRRSSLNWKNN